MQKVLLAEAVAAGDYLAVAADRVTPDGLRRGEGHARVEWVEHIARPAFLTRATHHRPSPYDELEDLVAVLCQGMPGAVLLENGDQRVERAVGPVRRAWDTANPTWPRRQAPLFTGGRIPESRPARRPDPAASGDEAAGSGHHDEDVPVRRRATAFTKRATEAVVGDYLQVHAQRHPISGMGVDEGYHRVEWAGHLPPDRAGVLLADPAWTRGTVTLLSVQGLWGTLVLPDTEVRVLVQPNVERVAEDQQEQWYNGPAHLITGTLVPDPEQARRADAARRPTAPDDEAGLYSSRISDPHQRALLLEGNSGVRPVAAAALPWPHYLFKCAFADRAKALNDTYPDTPDAAQAAHADLFAQLRPDEFASCPYHQADDWPAIARAVLAHAEAEQIGDEERARELSAMEDLSERDRHWAHRMLTDRIRWDEDLSRLTNGQHRVCAMRAAGVEILPVYGRYLPEQAPIAPTDAKRHARQAVTAFWTGHLTARWGTTFWSRWLGPAFARFPFLRGLLPKDDGQ
ncbi:hypothetical protein CTZ27_29765 [Streptomyces griseocarneus]|nr:hypothetical protein CTZ27_29765 [Streptomyces griseocarneus]